MRDATQDRVATYKLDAPILQPTLRQLWREWRCGRKHEHGIGGCYAPDVIVPRDRFRDTTEDGFRIWLQECQSCHRVTVWSERHA